eukprot:6180705-Alexandrium_andersonii.AAC.1
MVQRASVRHMTCLDANENAGTATQQAVVDLKGFTTGMAVSLGALQSEREACVNRAVATLGATSEGARTCT